MDKWSQRRWGVEIPSTAVGQVGRPADKTPALHKAECNSHLSHVVWADDGVLVSMSLETLQGRAEQLSPGLLGAKLELKG